MFLYLVSFSILSIQGMMMLLLSVALPLISTGPHTWTVWSDPVSSQYIFFTWTVWSGMVSAALVESNRLQIAQAEGLVHHKVAVPMSILWQGPQYFLQGVAEVFSNIGLTEFFYDESPDAMRSLCMAFSLANVSAGSYLSSFILSLVPVFTARGGSPGWIPDNLNEGHLDRFYLMMAGLSLLNILVFAFFATRYKCKKAS
jgi:peptide/histidine transporter 3/4